MSFVRSHKLVSIIVLTVSTIFLFVTVVFGRYIHNIIHNYILESKAFYFNSSVLGINGKNYSVVNWDGVNSYPLMIEVNNRKNDLRYTDVDIEYTISKTCPTTVTCTLSKTSSIIYTDEDEYSTDSYTLTVTPLRRFREGETVVVSTSVTSTYPYEKTMSATYTIGVQRSDFSYNIVDSVNSKYLTLNLINSISYYQASEDFGDYEEGDPISLDAYNLLSPTDQAKCFSAIVTVSYDPHDVFVDMTNPLYLKRLNTNYQEVTIGGFQYVSQFSFKVNAASSNAIIFYKDDVTQNYKYPADGVTPVITVSVVTADAINSE